MNQIQTTAIILSRTDYGEADRILTLLTPYHGKLRLIAKGVRRVKSRLAGGIELFSISEISFIKGRGDIGTLVSTRLTKHYGRIVQDVTRTMLGYDLIKQLNKATEDEPESDYFDLLEQAFVSLDDATISTETIRVWFLMQLQRLSGHSPNLETDVMGLKLAADQRYNFSFDDMAFMERPDGAFGADHIKFLRLGFRGIRPKGLQQIAGVDRLVADITPLVVTMLQMHVRT
ncbi:MAG TPA: DNA repair protein RecO [Candidatus Limnocylindrales bacterium]|nr:DNA repair protein RecO [Candidatus Limnocylindrales bacterium]